MEHLQEIEWVFFFHKESKFIYTLSPVEDPSGGWKAHIKATTNFEKLKQRPNPKRETWRYLLAMDFTWNAKDDCKQDVQVFWSSFCDGFYKDFMRWNTDWNYEDYCKQLEMFLQGQTSDTYSNNVWCKETGRKNFHAD